jgi:hypothetical protein
MTERRAQPNLTGQRLGGCQPRFGGTVIHKDVRQACEPGWKHNERLGGYGGF